MYEYGLDKGGRRILRGLSYEETQEFELLNAARPLNYSPPLTPAPGDMRWWELFSKYEMALQREYSRIRP